MSALPGNTPLARLVFADIADGAAHSGGQLAARHGVTRSGVWKAIRALRDLGADIESLPNRGYRLRNACGALAREALRRRLSRSVRAQIHSLSCEWSLLSTNATLLERGPPPPGRFDVCLSEHQSGGRGRRGRSWIAPLGGAICLSVAYRFEQLPRDIGALSLAVGACALQVLQSEGLSDVRLKWPNDLLARGRKLGGILIELRAEAGGPTHVVIGIGLNVSLGEAARSAVSRLGAVATDLTELGLADPQRNRLAAALIAALIEGITQFEAQGFAPFRARWHDADALLGLAVDVTGAGAAQRGVARGINQRGELQLDTPAGRVSILAGDVSVRAEQGA